MRLIYIFTLVFFALGLSGCTTPYTPKDRVDFKEHNGNMPWWQNNRGHGILNAGADITRDQMIDRMSLRCRQMNRWLNPASFQLEECYTGGHVCRHRYFCSDTPPPTTTAPAMNLSTEYTNSISNVNPKANIEDINASIKLAGDKCEELGFKKGTEKFGDCVLKISK